ncbi:MAG: hypothetical protein ACOC97_03340 [Myxococcota bacterium]
MTPGSFIRLGYYVGRQLLLRLLGRSRGLPQFVESYCAEDGLLPVSAEDRRLLAGFSRCIGCGMCDAYFAAYGRVDRRQFRAPSDLPLSYSRSLPDYDALGRYLAGLAEGDLALLERVCPTGVPFRALVLFAERQAKRLAAPSTGADA